MNPDAIDYADPRVLMERSEEESDIPSMDDDDGVQVLRRILFWVLDAKHFRAVATRAYVAAYIASPDVVQGITLAEIARLSGQGRSAAHNLAKEFEEKFSCRSIHARSAEARLKYSKAYHAANGTRPHAYNPIRTT